MTAEDLRTTAQRLKAAGRELRRLPVETRCRRLTAAAARLADPEDDLGRRAREVLPATTGLSPAMVDWALRTSVEPWLEPGPDGGTALEALLRQAGPDAEATPVPPASTVLILAGNVFTAALRPLLLGLAAGTPILVKLPGGNDPETSLPGLLRDALISLPPTQGGHTGPPLHRIPDPRSPAQGTHRGVPLHSDPESGVGVGPCAYPAAQPHPIPGSTQSPAQGTHRGVPLHSDPESGVGASQCGRPGGRGPAPHLEEPLGDALAITHLPSDDPDFEALLFDDPARALATGAPDLVVAYGSDATMANLRRRLPPTIRLLEHGHGASAAWLPASALTPTHIDASARALALDVAAYDQRGCLSPLIAWVERDSEVSDSEVSDSEGSAADFAARVHQALRELAIDLPPGPIDTATGAARAQWRGTAAVVGQLFESDDSAVVYVEDASLLPPAPLHRHLAVVPCASVDELGRQLQPWGVHLKCLGVGGDAAEMERAAGVLPPPLVPRLCPLGHMQRPPASWCAEGRGPFEGWLRWLNSQ